jgi:uncharacterized membrane protein YfcA
MSEHALRMALLATLGVLGLYFTAVFIAGLREARAAGRVQPTVQEMVTGFVTVFFDTLGIGSFATTTAIFRAWRLVPDELIPGTLNVGHAIESVLSAFVFIEVVPVAASTLIPMVAASAIGAWLGSGVVAGLRRDRIRLGIGAALVVAASMMMMTQLGLLPAGADALGLDWPLLGIAVAGNFVLGALMTLGIGLYAPCMILVALLGMNPKAAFPIMMGSCAFLMPIGSLKFIRRERYSLRASLGLGIGGVPAVLIAALIVKSLPLYYLRWLVVVVVLYAALSMLRSALVESRPASPPAVP